MTKAEFAQGWKLLLVQPWGWRYRGLDANGQPTQEAALQLDFYYNKLSWASPQAWQEVATRFAEGEEWPSIMVLNQALRHINSRFVPTLPPTTRGREAPSISEIEARKILARMGITLP